MQLTLGDTSLGLVYHTMGTAGCGDSQSSHACCGCPRICPRHWGILADFLTYLSGRSSISVHLRNQSIRDCVMFMWVGSLQAVTGA